MRPVLDQICGSQLALMQYNRRSFEAWIETLDFKSQDFSLTAFAAVDLLLKELVFVYRHESWIEQSFINFLKGRKEQLRCRSMNLFHAMNTPAVFLVSSVQCVQHNKSNSPWPIETRHTVRILENANNLSKSCIQTQSLVPQQCETSSNVYTKVQSCVPTFCCLCLDLIIAKKSWFSCFCFR